VDAKFCLNGAARLKHAAVTSKTGLGIAAPHLLTPGSRSAPPSGAKTISESA
jgi:hypothetical protein